MSASDDDADIPLVFTARKPGYTPPKEYVQFLDMGGELAKLFSLTEVKALKAAVLLLKNRSMAELGIAIDETGQADEQMRRIGTRSTTCRRATNSLLRPDPCLRGASLSLTTCLFTSRPARRQNCDVLR